MSIDEFIEFRKHVPLTKNWAYFETAGTGLIPDFVYEGVKRYQDARYLTGGDSVWLYDDGQELGTLDMMDRSKKALAEMINCQKEDIAFGQNSSQLFTLFSEGLDLSAGDNVVLPKGGWISNRFAWQMLEKKGVELRYAEPVNGVLTPEMVTSMCDDRTKAVSVTYVESATGFRVDVNTLGAFCRKNQIWFVVDGVQVLGVLPVDVEKSNIDFLVGNDYKWMMNYCGTGYAYISPKLRPILNHCGAGWMSDDERFNTAKEVLRLRSDAGRFELGYPTATGIYGVGLVAEKYNSLGRNNIENYVLDLQDYLHQQIEDINGVRIFNEYSRENRSSISNIIFEKSVAITNEEFEANSIFAHVRSFDAEGRLLTRVSLHYYNDKSDIDQLCEVIKRKALK